ncbi:MAG: hypothetical protein CMM50_04785 [Rhodospirillaceae bacterium]|nr:hypothetical protein [Rhodospirillaceae bacterium]|tara:strand:- start:480 stop:800 length:321 start_codon:yes stop_codon:yes gene_type:complete
MDSGTLVSALATLFLVLLLIVGLGWALRRFGFGMGGMGRRGSMTSRRLAIVEIAPLDMKRRLVLIRRDEVEHLILLGAQTETVVERGITARPRFEALVEPAEETDA